MSVDVGPRGLVVKGRTVPLISGDIHYWRHPAKLWPTLLNRVREMGLRMICTYIPWSVHETSAGSFDFGDLEPSKNVGAFIDLAHETGLAVLVRPGPHINAELTYFGYPPRLFEDPTFHARNSRGGPVILPVLPRAFPVISYAAEPFWRELEVWLDALAPILRHRLHPYGPIFGLQLDNEMSFFFRNAPFDQDYHPDSRSKWIEFLKEKYGGAEAVAERYGLSIPLAELPIPDQFRAKTPKDLAYYTDWIEFKEETIAGTLARLRALWEDRGVRDIVFSHNFPVTAPQSPLSITRCEKHVAYCGVDFYMHKTEFALLKRRLLFLTGQSRFPVSPEFASGCYQFWPPVDLEDQRFTTLVAWMYGLKGVNFYMAVERERWYGSPITRSGSIRKNYWDLYRELFALVDRIRPWNLRRKIPICLLSVRDYERLENATLALDPISPMLLEGRYPLEELCLEDTFGFSRPIQLLHAKMLRGWEWALSRMGVPYVIGSSDLDAQTLGSYQAVVCPTFEYLDQTAQQTLAAYVESGGNLICGPEVPAFDAEMKEFSTLDGFTSRPTHRLDCAIDTLVCNAGSGRIILVSEVPLPIEAAEPTVQAILRHIHIEPVYPCTPPCETSLHLGPEGERILFVVNPTAEPRRPQIRVTPGQHLIDQITDERFFGDQWIPLDMPAYTVRVLEVSPC